MTPLSVDKKVATLTGRICYFSVHKREMGKKESWRCRGSNPGPFTCKANALPLSYIPSDLVNVQSQPIPLKGQVYEAKLAM